MLLPTRALAAGLLVLSAIASPRAAAAQSPAGTVSGRITDRNARPIAGATVALVDLDRAAITDSTGAFSLGLTPAGRYTVTARRLSFAPAAVTITVRAGEPSVVTLTLHSGAQHIEPVNVTATRAPVDALSSPLPISVLTGDEVDRTGGVSLAHSVAKLAGVRNVGTGEQIGKPMIRGLFGPRILVLADGSRLEDYSWSDEDGPSIDPRMAQRIEVIRGPAGVLYGSDALSGVVNVVPADLPFSSDGTRLRRQALEAYGASNNLELGGAAMLEGAQSKYGWRVMGTGRASQNYQTPNGAVPNSSFWAYNGEGAFGIRGPRDNTVLRAAHYGGEFHLLEATGPDPADPDGGPVRQVLDDRLQLTNNHLLRGLRLETKAQYQRHALTEVSDDCVPVPPQTTCAKVKDRKAFGLVLNTGTLDVLLHHAVGEMLSGAVGVSGTLQGSGSSGPIFLVPSASMHAAGLFAFEELITGRLTFVGGLRGDTRQLATDAQPEIGHTADSRSWRATSADLGVVLRATNALAFVANYGGGWRAPTLFDLYANGPNVPEARYEVGDASLRTERSHDLDGGIRWQSPRVRAEVNVYRNLVDDFIYTAPTAATQNGLRVYRHAQTDARLIGGEASIEARLSDRLTVRASHDRVEGEDRTAGTPLPLIPPPRTIVGASVGLGRLGSWDRLSVGSEAEVNATQTRLNDNDFPTEGYTLVNLDLSAEHVVRARSVRFDLDIRNALNASHRDYLSRFKEFATAPGVGVILKLSTGAW